MTVDLDPLLARARLATTSGLTLFIRRSAGLTSRLKPQRELLALLEGPCPSNPTAAVLQSDRLLLIGGGIGITGLLPYLWSHPHGKLFHSVKTADRCLVDALSASLDEACEKEIVVGRRLDVNALLQKEAALGWSKVGVVVCGPALMCDSVRVAVARLGRERAGGCLFELQVDSFAL